MKTENEIKEKLKFMGKNTNITNVTKNFYWQQALEWVLEIEEEEE